MGQNGAWETQVFSLLLRNGAPGHNISLSAFSIWYSFPLLRSSVSLNLPHYVHSRSLRRALVSHSACALPRHIWFLVRLIMFNNVRGSAHPSRAPFICLDITAGSESLKEGKKRLLCRMTIRPRMDDVCVRVCGGGLVNLRQDKNWSTLKHIQNLL